MLAELARYLSTSDDPDDLDDFLVDGKFKCIECGACCKEMDWAYPQLTVQGTTRCQHLQEDNRCEIYETRPYFCRVSNFPQIPDRTVAKICSWMRKRHATS